jgi:integrase/recombinase XerD
MTFRDLYRDCAVQLGKDGYSSETIHVYERTYSQFLAYLKARGLHDDVRSFSDDHVQGFAEDLGRRGIHPNTIIKALSAMSTLAKYGMRQKDLKGRRLVAADPTKAFPWPQAQRHETQFLYRDDLRKLVDIEAEPYKRIACDILIETGIRVGEACRLNVDDFREAGGRYYLAVAVKGRGQQRHQQTRDVPLSKPVADRLRAWLNDRVAVDRHAPLLINSDGERWKRAPLSNMVSRLAEKAGITRLRVSAHKLRHTANVIARLADVDAATRSRLLGHSSLRSLERYDHVLPHELHQAREQQLASLRDYIGKADLLIPEAEETERNERGATPRSDEGR